MSVVVITGTGTGVGKTIATAALACRARTIGLDVAVCKPIQTGTVDGDDDLAEIGRLAGVANLVSVARYTEPLAPVAAAALDRRPLPALDRLLTVIGELDRTDRLTLVEGAGGLLVELTDSGATLRDLAQRLSASVLVVCEAGLGTLNHTALTLEALENRGLACAGLVLGRWPSEPGAAERSNLAALERLAPLRAVLPDGAASLPVPEFGVLSAQSFDADWVAGLL